MLTGVDRIQACAARAEEVAGRWVELLDGEIVGEDRIDLLRARRLTVAVGDSLVEVLEPLGPGPVADHLESRRGGPFAAGLATADLDGVATRLRDLGVAFDREGVQLFLDATQLGIPGLRVVLSAAQRRAPVGRLQTLYEVTHLTADADGAGQRLAELFALDPAHYVPIESENYGYRGALTLFHPERLDRIETIFPFDTTKTMGRFFSRFGPSLYMCYAECADTRSLRDLLRARVADDWTGAPEGAADSLFIHPRALGGVMLGVSRTTFAWTWSGSPARVSGTG